MTKPALFTFVLGVAACKSSGMGTEVRTDIQTQMASAKPALDDCYKTALKSNRRLRGMITVDLIAEASTGLFKNVAIRRDELQDPTVRQCIQSEITKLKLATPTSANVQFSYPFRFSPTN